MSNMNSMSKNRIVDIDIGGKTWPMCLTLRAYTDICQRYGSMPACLEKLDGLVEAADNGGLIEEYTWLLEKLLWSARAAQDLPLETDPDNLPPMQDGLLDLLAPGDIPYVQLKVLAAIRAGQERTVGVDAPKNGEGADGQAPED